MRILKQGETSSKSCTVENDVVTVVHTSVHPLLPKGAEYQLTWKFNFASASKEQILVWAAKHLVITVRRIFKGVEKPSAEQWDNVVFDPCDYITERATKQERLAKEVKSMSVEQRIELLKLLQSDDEENKS